jgi:hypothetical protein
MKPILTFMVLVSYFIIVPILILATIKFTLVFNLLNFFFSIVWVQSFIPPIELFLKLLIRLVVAI